jgi:hypothetical protein
MDGFFIFTLSLETPKLLIHMYSPIYGRLNSKEAASAPVQSADSSKIKAALCLVYHFHLDYLKG